MITVSGLMYRSVLGSVLGSAAGPMLGSLACSVRWLAVGSAIGSLPGLARLRITFGGRFYEFHP
jgi:hypothetical protein